MSMPFVCLVVLLVVCAGFSAGFIVGSFWTTIGILDRQAREDEFASHAPYPHAWE